MDSLPIGEYALLSDCRSAALISRDGSVDRLCFPRFDGPSVFCRLLDPAGGHFAIRPAGEFQVSRRYVDQTLVLETTFTTARGTAVLTDALAVGRNERGHRLGAHSPGTLLRSLTCARGEIQAEVSYAPRPEYGLIHPVLVPVPGGLTARGGANPSPAAHRARLSAAAASRSGLQHPPPAEVRSSLASEGGQLPVARISGASALAASAMDSGPVPPASSTTR